MSTLAEKRAAILEEIAKGSQSISSGSNSITKRDMKQLQLALAIIDNEIAKASTSTSTIGRIYTREGL